MAALFEEIDAQREAEEAEKNRKQSVRRLTARVEEIGAALAGARHVASLAAGRLKDNQRTLWRRSLLP